MLLKKAPDSSFLEWRTTGDRAALLDPCIAAFEASEFCSLN
jgi:hypothetical protein